MKHRREKGFTTLELSIVLIIFSMIMMSVMYFFTLYNKQKTLDDTSEAMDVIKQALIEFKGMYGAYPCPADPTIGPGNPNYGREVRTPNPWPDLNSTCVTPWTATAGIAPNTVPGLDTQGDADALPDDVRVGAVPWATLMDPDNNPATDDGVYYAPITEDKTIDPWGRKFTYAVTDRLTKKSTYNDFLGAINIVDENNNSILDLEDQNQNGVLDAGEDVNGNGVLDPGRLAHAVIITHGENGVGAYTRQGNIVQACPAALIPAVFPEVASPVNEIENCDPDGTFLSGLRIEKQHSYNDDKVRMILSENSNLWTYVSLNQIQNTNPGNVGIGTRQPQEKLHVSGDLVAITARASEYCDITNNFCMPPQTLGGNGVNNAAMQCPPGKVVSSIEVNKVNCVDAFVLAPNTVCPGPTDPANYTYLGGISNINGIICCPDTGCP